MKSLSIIQWLSRGILLSSAVLMIGCASAPAEPTDDIDSRDRIEGFNRAMWDLNYDVLDPAILRPATVGYTKVVPEAGRKGIDNLLTNLREPDSFVNAALQGKPESMAITAGRFLVNSTIGIFGLFDVATKIGLQERKEDFGQTLAVWGVGDGSFLMIPARGPSTIRDTTGDLIDGFYSPLGLFNTPLTITRYVLYGLTQREKAMAMEHLLEDSLDPYAFIREAYLQNRLHEIYDGNPPEQDDYDDSYLDEFLN
ncbi:VacJ family lipoprotein [Alkalimonas collagenimarina]|uniref:VacJ family lipoprotein n=2 Tax=Alkalimonas collagenimarina TaxID=400390 RepID=A0ABT9H2N7_9GAMM|nr:VacJ family lipoprotein [Alkalimonas collagenimarina]MDP4537576.1 VacJ family lipoprotein [Alkalimonas collagenimarina]